MLCCGATHSSLFVGCIFASCSLYAVHGASVRLRSCRFVHSEPGAVVNGHSTVAVFESCLFAGSCNAVIVEGKAAAVISGCDMLLNTVSVTVNDEQSSCTVTESQFTGKQSQDIDESELEDFVHVGVRVRGGSVHLHRCSILRHQVAVRVGSTYGTLRNLQSPAAAADRLRCVAEVSQCRIRHSRCIATHGRAMARLRNSIVDAMASPSEPEAPVDKLTDSDYGAVTMTASRQKVGPDGQLLVPICNSLIVECCVIRAKKCEAVSVRAFGVCRLFISSCRLFSHGRGLRFGGGVRGSVSRCWVSSGLACFTGRGPGPSRGVTPNPMQMNIRGCRMISSEAACIVEGAMFSLCVVDSVLRGRMKQGVEYCNIFAVNVSSGAKAVLLRCNIRDSFNGAQAIGPGSVLNAVDTSVCRMFHGPRRNAQGEMFLSFEEGNAYWCESATLKIDGGSIQDCNSGLFCRGTAGDPPSFVADSSSEAEPESHDPSRHKGAAGGCDLLAQGSGFSGRHGVASAIVRGVVFWNCGVAIGSLKFSGDVVADSCDIFGCRSSLPQRDHSYMASLEPESGAMVATGIWLHNVIGQTGALHCRVHHCRFYDNIVAVHCAGARFLQMGGCTFDSDQSNARGLVAGKSNNIVLKGCQFGNMPLFLTQACQASIDRCSFVECHGEAAAVGVQGHSKVYIAQCDFWGCATGVSASGGANINVSGTIMRHTDRCVVLQGPYWTFSATGCKMEHAAVMVEGRYCVSDSACMDRSLTLTDCQLSGAGMAVRVLGPGIFGKLERCCISKCDIGLYMADLVAMQILECGVDACRWGVMVGRNQLDAMDACVACKREGQSAWAVARRAVQCEGAPVPGVGGWQGRARCAHDGAVSRLHMVSGEVTNCRYGVRVNEFGLVHARRVTFRKCTKAVSAVYLERDRPAVSGALGELEFTDCVVSQCGKGELMIVWPRGADDEGGCVERAIPGLT